MKENKSAGKKKNEQNLIEQLWLHQYNQILFVKGLITEQEFDRMKSKINSRNKYT